MKVLAISTNLADPTPFLADEMHRMAELQRDGVVERVLLKADRSGAVLLVEAPDLGAAQSAVATLPLVEQGITRFACTAVVDPAELVPLKPPTDLPGAGIAPAPELP